jgi:hypothetical protein
MTRLLHSQMLTALGFAALLSMSAAARADSHDGSHDFDFTFGTWTEHSRRLLHPLSGSNEWVEWDGRTKDLGRSRQHGRVQGCHAVRSA